MRFLVFDFGVYAMSGMLLRVRYTTSGQCFVHERARGYAGWHVGGTAPIAQRISTAAFGTGVGYAASDVRL
eukprot:429881-Rhodomonas_salina.3